MGPCQLGGFGSSSSHPNSSCRASPSQNLPCAMGCSQYTLENRVGKNLRACLVHPPEGRINSTCILPDWSFSSLFMELPGSAGKLPHGSFTHVARKFLQNLKPASLLLSTETTHTRHRERFLLLLFSSHLKIILLPLHLL